MDGAVAHGRRGVCIGPRSARRRSERTSYRALGPRRHRKLVRRPAARRDRGLRADDCPLGDRQPASQQERRRARARRGDGRLRAEAASRRPPGRRPDLRRHPRSGSVERRQGPRPDGAELRRPGARHLARVGGRRRRPIVGAVRRVPRNGDAPRRRSGDRVDATGLWRDERAPHRHRLGEVPDRPFGGRRCGPVSAESGDGAVPPDAPADAGRRGAARDADGRRHALRARHGATRVAGEPRRGAAARGGQLLRFRRHGLPRGPRGVRPRVPPPAAPTSAGC